MASPPVDYGKVIEDALASASMNGHRMEAVARVMQAYAYCEATRACAQAKGFPLAVESSLETFWIGTGSPSVLMAPNFMFTRDGARLSAEPHLIMPAAFEDPPGAITWTPGETAGPNAWVQRLILGVVATLARNHTLARPR